MADALTAQQTADAVGVHLFANDRASKAMGMRIVAISEGEAFLEMPVRDDMVNGFDICHGGFITTLADSAFAFACNSTGDMTVAAGLTVDFLAPAPWPASPGSTRRPFTRCARPRTIATCSPRWFVTVMS